jgi:hypothetical protein
MRDLLKRAGRAILMGIMWAVAWSPIGPIAGQILDPLDTMDEPWLMVGILPGFFCGIAFAVAIAIAERGRRFDKLSSRRIVQWGALAGVITGSLPLVLGDPSGSDVFPLRLLTLPLTIGVAGAITSAATLALARRAEFNLLDDEPVA